MSDPRSARGGKEPSGNVSPSSFPPQFYPMPGYQGPPPWFPGQPNAGPPPPWGASWNPPMGFPTAPVSAWSSPNMMPTNTTTTSASMPTDEYTVDTMRRIYNDDDGRVEIQRVKVHRRPPEGPVQYPTGPESMSVVPVGAFPLNERRPPPRKKKQLQVMQAAAAQGQPYPWYPYMPCMPYPVPYPYYYGGCMWTPGGSTPAWSGPEESERTSSRQESLPTTLDSQRLESRTSDPLRGSVSPVSARSPSPAAGSHVTDAHSLAPSDSVSMRGYKRESSLERALMCPTPPPRTRSRAGTERKSSTDVGKMHDWFDTQRAITASGDAASAPIDIVPPKRKHRGAKLARLSERSSSLDQKDDDDMSDKQSISSVGSESLLSPELTYAFKKLEQSVDAFKTKVSNESTPIHTPQRMPSPLPVPSSGEQTPTMEDASMSIDISSAIKSAVTDVTDVVDTKSNGLPETPSSPPPLETISSAFFSETSKEETTVKSEEGPPSLTTSETSSSQASVATTIQTTDVSTAQPVESEQKTVEKNEVTPTVPQPTEETAAPTEGPSTEAPKPTEKTPTTAEKETSTHPPQPTDIEMKKPDFDEMSGRESRASDSTFFSIRASDDQLLIDTDSTDILLPTTDATTADEGDDHTDSTVASPIMDDNEGYQWVLQQEPPDLTGTKEDEQRNAWRAEVSLWRARLVVSLCRGRGLDRQDWSTFHLLVRHPLTLDLKLSLLHAPRLCSANSTIGAALVRVALIHLAQYGETLLQPDNARQTGWRSIKVDPNQSWAPVKGAIEILQALGYKQREEGVLRYPRRSGGPEVSVLARLTLDMLVLAEELRLYLTGMHQYPINISDLFFSGTTPIPPSPDLPMLDIPQRPQSSASSYSFISAQSSASLDLRPDSRASVTDEETDTLQATEKQGKTSKKTRRESSSEEEVTLREDNKDVKGNSTEEVQDQLEEDLPLEDTPMLASDVLRKKEEQRPGSTLSLPMSPVDRSSLSTMTSMPDLQSIRSSTTSRGSQQRPGSHSSGTPSTTPAPGNDNPEDHIYEEIDVIRAQAQALRSASVPAQSPPPLPPKKKVSSGEDDSGLSLTYPKVEWTSASTPSSLRGGSTGARRKKRRAPMPPDFMPPDWRPYQNRPLPKVEGANEDQVDESISETPEEEKKRKDEYRRSLNPFYEDIESVKEKVKEIEAAEDDKNPFAKEDASVAGYIGKNPFYEDVELLKPKEKESSEENKKGKHYDKVSSTSKEGEARKSEVKYSGMGSLLELQDDSILIKTKRKAPRPPPTPDPTSENSTTTTPAVSETPAATPHPPSASKPPSAPQQSGTPRSSSIPRNASTPQPTSAEQSTSPPPRPPTPKRTPTPQRTSTSEPSKPSEVPKEEPNQQTTEEEEVKPPLPAKLRNGEKNNAKIPTNQDTPKPNENQNGLQSKEENKEKENEDSQTPDKTEEARQVISKAIKNQQQRVQLQHPKTPPPPPPASLKPTPPAASSPSESKPTEEKRTSSDSSAPPEESRASLAFLEEIPYMDANEVKNSEPKKVSKTKDQQYEIIEPPGKATTPVPLSPTVMRQTALLLRGSRPVPFIDESDLPPDCPPPPPPGPPPDSPPNSPPDTPHTSPPETPHNSPPETPHASPPETPKGSPTSSPITVPATITTPTPEEQRIDTDKSSQIRQPATDTLQTTTEKDDPPALPPKTNQITAASKNKIEDNQTTLQRKTSDNNKPQTKTSPASKSLEDRDPASVRSSVSEDRYEIPEISNHVSNPPDASDSKTSSSALPDDPKTESTKEDQATSKPSEPYVPTSESDKYEIPEAPKETVVEERYEIPEVVKETALNGGASNVPRSFLGNAIIPGRRNLESVFGPPKPPRRRRNTHSPPPPRPPKSASLDSSSQPKLPPKTGSVIRPGSTTSSFSTTSGTTGSTVPTPASMSVPTTPRPIKGDKSKSARKSWPFLLCDCLYANCRTYDDAK